MWKNYCLVGFGSHCQNRLMPALKNIKKNIVGIVTTKNKNEINFDSLIFQSIDQAIKRLPEDTVFVISTPPKNHFTDVCKLILLNRDVIVEKPAFIKTKEIDIIEKIFKKSNSILVELFMYKYTKIYEIFYKTWLENKENIKQISCNFFIPSVPLNTFRKNKSINDSCLYDLGCYPISLLIDLDLNLSHILIDKFMYDNSNHQIIKMKTSSNGIKININLGVGFSYENNINLKLKNDKQINFQTFFYGVEKLKTINFYDKQYLKSDNFIDNNGFEKLFNLKRKFWLDNQVSRFDNIKKVTSVLEDIANNTKIINIMN